MQTHQKSDEEEEKKLMSLTKSITESRNFLVSQKIICEWFNPFLCQKDHEVFFSYDILEHWIWQIKISSSFSSRLHI